MRRTHDLYTVNSVTSIPNADGSVTIRFVTREPTEPNSIPVPPGWNYLVRLYRPRAEFFEGSWALPEAVAIYLTAGRSHTWPDGLGRGVVGDSTR